MTHVKQPAVAGMFYPDKPTVLSQDIDQLLADAATDGGSRPRALIVPHAGYQYSGPVAASAYACLRNWADSIDRVVVLAPSHRVPFRGIATSSADEFATPLGTIAVDKDSVKALLDQPGVIEFDPAFAQEHALEVQLPFLQRAVGGFRLVPLIVGEASDTLLSHLLESLWREDTLVVISSDLSHFLDYEHCQQKDRRTSEAIEKLDSTVIGPHEACGFQPLNGMLTLARKLGLHVTRLDLRNSGDTAGDKQRVVGYGAYRIDD